VDLAPVHETARIRHVRERLDAVGEAQVPPAPTFEKRGAEMHLHDARRLPGDAVSIRHFDACTGHVTHSGPAGTSALHHLPDGDHRLLAYRVGSVIKLSQAFKPTRGSMQSLSLSLDAASPAENLVYDPTMPLWRKREAARSANELHHHNGRPFE
jgi:hypothetical protein